jgi:hypothetical protein
MAEGLRIFTLEEANALLPALELALGHLARLRAQLEQAIAAVGGPEVAVAVLAHGVSTAGQDREHEARRLAAAAEEVRVAVERINAHGCILKDIDSGLVDFYALREDEPVFLCWQLGEPRVTHWHPLDGGFAARQPIEGVEIERPKFPN